MKIGLMVKGLEVLRKWSSPTLRATAAAAPSTPARSCPKPTQLPALPDPSGHQGWPSDPHPTPPRLTGKTESSHRARDEAFGGVWGKVPSGGGGGSKVYNDNNDNHIYTI